MTKIRFTKHRKKRICWKIVKSNPIPFLKGQLQGIARGHSMPEMLRQLPRPDCIFFLRRLYDDHNKIKEVVKSCQILDIVKEE